MTISDIPSTGLPDDTRVGTEAGSHDADSSAVDRSRMLQDLDATGRGYDARTVVVGVTPRQPDRVVNLVLRWAEAGLVHRISFLYVAGDVSEVVADDGGEADGDHGEAGEFKRRMTGLIQSHGVHATYARVSGDPADRLAAEARKLGAAAIVVGTRERGPAAAVNEWVRGSISVRLEHTQSVPVVVIPLRDARYASHHTGAGFSADDTKAGGVEAPGAEEPDDVPTSGVRTGGVTAGDVDNGGVRNGTALPKTATSKEARR